MTRRRATITTLLITVLLTAIVQFTYTHAPAFDLPLLQPVATTPGYYRVKQAVDGDTLQIDMSGQQETVRLIGVDTPETHKPNTPVQCYGPEASDYARKRLEGKPVRLEADPTNDNRDRYGRLLRYVYLEDGTLFNKEIIQQGYGFAYLSFPFQKKNEFSAAQDTALTAHHGLWTTCKPFQEKSGRWQTEPYF